MAKEADIKKDRDEAYDQAIKYWSGAINEMKHDVRFALGDQWKTDDKTYLKGQRREALVFNKTHRIIKIITGYQRKNRLALKFDPMEGGDAFTASQLTKIAMQIMAANDGYNVMSDAFEKGSLIAGINLVGLHVDYMDDMINGDIKMTRWPYNSFVLDPNFSQPDLSDCGYILLRQFISKDAILSMIPASKRSIIKDLHPTGSDSKFPHLGTNQNMKGEYNFKYDEFWVQNYETYKVLINTVTRESQIWTRDEGTLRILLANFPTLRVIERTKRSVKLYVFVEDHLVYEGNPWGIDEYPYVPVMGFFTPEADDAKLKIQGIVRLVRDPQEEVNKRRSKMLDIIDSIIASGWKAKQNSVVDPGQLYISGQGKVVWMKEGYNMDDAEELRGGTIPEGLFRLSEIFDKDIIEIPGANDDLLGTPDSPDINVAGILAKLRQASGITILQDLYDNYRRSKTMLGRKIIKMVQANYTPQKIMRLISEQPSPQFYNKDFGKYDCVPCEGLLTDTQRHMYFTQLMMLKQLGAPIPWSEVVENAPVEGKDKLVQIIKQAEQAQSQQADVMMKMNEVFNMLNAAKTQTEIAEADDKRTEAQANIANALLDKVRMLKELDQIGVGKIANLLKIANEIEKSKQKPAITKR